MKTSSAMATGRLWNELLVILLVFGSAAANKLNVDESGKTTVKEEWGEWIEVIPCSRTCGGGVQFLERKCHKVGPDGWPFCTGPSGTYVSCNVQDCPTGSLDFRLAQCEHYNTIPFNGSFYEWEPYYHATNKCALYCQAKGQSFYYRHADKVIDGTPCEIQSPNMCVNGICEPVGCDRKLGSGKRFDNCMVCGGDNKTCKSVQGSKDTHSMKTGYNKLVRIPEGATMITVEEEADSRNFLAVKSVQGDYFLNGDFTIDIGQVKTMAGTAFEYRRSLAGMEFLVSQGPLKEPLLVEVLKQPGNSSAVRFKYFVPLSLGSSVSVDDVSAIRQDVEAVRSPSLKVSWSIGEWGSCSTTCGDGVQKRIVECKAQRNGALITVDDSLCQLAKPSTLGPCNTDKPCAHWITGAWSDCSQVCGAGEQTREVHCVSGKQTIGGRHQIQPDNLCGHEAKPLARRSCMRGPCEAVEWIVSDWGGCHNLCDTAMEHRLVICSSRDGRIRPDDACDSQRRPESERRCPPMATCEVPVQWHASQWNPCSSSCGAGIQRRKVFCAEMENNVLRIVSSSRCDQDYKMAEEQTCTGDCLALWYTGPFGNCSVQCDGGQRQRLVLCFAGDAVVDESKCNHNSRPDDMEDCNQHPCTDDELLPSNLCRNSRHGCCSDGLTVAEGPNYEGCSTISDPVPSGFCAESAFGCCFDGVTAARGHNHEGCPDSQQVTTQTTIERNCGTGEERPDDGSGTVCEGIPESPLSPVIDCNLSEFGCCNDGVMAALGPDGFGCQEVASPNDCSNHLYGCCSDSLTPALGPDLEGCPEASTLSTLDNYVTCDESAYGCCGNGVSTALGPGLEGCPETTTETPEPLSPSENTPFSYCPDGETPAKGPNHEGCKGAPSETNTCEQTHFGCCPNGVTPAQGPNHEGCQGPSRTCDISAYRCCLDGHTEAQGPNFEGCHNTEKYMITCFDSPYGCCSNGITPASGPHNIGCPSRMTRGGICSLAKDSSFCTNYTVKWSYDVALGECSRFWYGGCEGNSNKFDSEDDCQLTCVQPQGLDRCFLPPSGGRCRAAHINYFYNAETRQCEQFSYGGCGGNNNRFDSIEHCEQICAEPLKPDVCSQPHSSGPCRGHFERWYYDKGNGLCRPFIYGGCKGNENQFETLEACQQRCREPASHVCKLESDPGPCDRKSTVWYFNPKVSQCETFTYGGCLGNANRFSSREECSNICERLLKQKSVDICMLPAETGLCRGYFERWYYNPTDGYCKQFVYGGCGGNANRFESEADCRSTCRAKPPVDVCHLPKVEGPCQDYVVRYYFDADSLQCHQFYFGGCDSNGNNFHTLAECEKKCQRATLVIEATILPVPASTQAASGTDACSLPVEHGPCRKSLGRWYYDTYHARCIHFAYGGCEGNANRFMTQEECMNQCGYRNGPPDPKTLFPSYAKSPAPELLVIEQPVTEQPVTERPTIQDICMLPAETGLCRGYFERWYYSPTDGYCKQFVYGGCGGNVNRFESEADCQSTCRAKPPVDDVCKMSKETGTCDDYVAVWYFEPNSRSCRRFLYSGCGGNGNRFSSEVECESKCIQTHTVDSEHVEHHTSIDATQFPLDPAVEHHFIEEPNVAETDISAEILEPSSVCLLPAEVGDCFSYEQRWHLDPSYGRCTLFYYGGCGGNANNFLTEEQCERLCQPYLRIDQTRETSREETSRTYELPAVQTLAGGTVTLPYRGSQPVTHIVWYRDRQIISQDDSSVDQRIRFLSDGSLEISDIQRSDVRNYVYYDGQDTVTVPLEVYVSANIQDSNTTEIMAGTEVPVDVELQCDYFGIPNPEVRWLRDGQRLDTGNRLTIFGEALPAQDLERSVLKIRELELEDSGSYTCEIRNNVPGLFSSVQTKHFVVKVLGSLVMSVVTDRKAYHVGEEARLLCETTGRKDVEMEIKWTRNGEPLPTDDPERYKQPSTDILLIERVVKEDTGEYRCTARRRIMKDEEMVSAPILITVITVPIPPNCEDKPWYANCKLIIEAHLCRHAYFSIFCCKSCHEAGHLP